MKLSPKEIEERVSKSPGWTYANNALTRQYVLPSFPDAVAFVTRLGFDAEAADHHPDLLVNYKRVTVTWSTHDAGGVTDKDFAGARQSDTIARQFGAV